MRPIDAQFVHQRSRFAAWALGFVFVATLMGLLFLLRAWPLHAERERLRAAIREASTLQVGSVAPSFPADTETPWSTDARRHLERAAFDVGLVLRALESARVPGVKVTSVEALAETRLARVEIEATAADDVLAYLTALNAGESVQRWRLVRSSARGGTELFSATLEANWEEVR